MSDLDVIEIPGHPGMYARRIAVRMWQAAGSPPINDGGAGRLKAYQQWLYNQWREGVPGYNPADNPNEEWRPLVHVRFIGLDVPPRYVPAMRAAGFETPYDYEPWHCQVPNWRAYPLVTALPATAGSGGTAFNPINTIQEDDMATLITGGGQSLVIGNKLIGFATAAEVQAVKGAQVLEVSATTHYNIIQAFQRDGGKGLPVRVFVKGGGDGTVYLLSDGKLSPLVDPNTLAELEARGGASITLSQAEITNLLAG